MRKEPHAPLGFAAWGVSPGSGTQAPAPSAQRHLWPLGAKAKSAPRPTKLCYTSPKKQKREMTETQSALKQLRPPPTPFAQSPIFLSPFFLHFNLPTEVLGLEKSLVQAKFRGFSDSRLFFCSPV